MSDTEEVVLYAEFTAKPGAADEVEELLRGFAQTVRAEPGNVTFDVYRRAGLAQAGSTCSRSIATARLSRSTSRPSPGGTFNDALGELIVEAGSELTFLQPAARQ